MLVHVTNMRIAVTTGNEDKIQSKITPADIDGAGQDRYLTARQVWERYGVTSMTLWRWLNDERIGIPKPTYFGRFRYWLLSDLLAWERKCAKERCNEYKGPERSIDAYGIKCTSRYGLEAELNRMKGLAKLLSICDVPVTEIYCDSKIGYQYVVKLSVRDDEVATGVASAIGGLTAHFHGGHNGVVVRFGDDVLAIAETDWLPRPSPERGRQ